MIVETEDVNLEVGQGMPEIGVNKRRKWRELYNGHRGVSRSWKQKILPLPMGLHPARFGIYSLQATESDGAETRPLARTLQRLCHVRSTWETSAQRRGLSWADIHRSRHRRRPSPHPPRPPTTFAMVSTILEGLSSCTVGLAMDDAWLLDDGWVSCRVDEASLACADITLAFQATAELAATYAALILADDGIEITVSTEANLFLYLRSNFTFHSQTKLPP